ncbi:hypothetical protein [Geopsychrobacter electrodiphilus]|uniref:hypothetical protein n=1 Tax=Geopsychrobacter electrodiphilus TaxID=225196 RepID=UPI0003696B76|nr:hypothetical protein [Geopsychrobacter electrodiphilus]
MTRRLAQGFCLLLLLFARANLAVAVTSSIEPADPANKFLTPVAEDRSLEFYLENPDPLLHGLTDDEVLHLGERMYREGILPSGQVMEALYGEMSVDSSAFSCESCHLRSGVGSVEGGVVTPAATGRKLYKPYIRPPSIQDRPDINGRYTYAKTIQKRPAYTRESLKEALRYGDDPAGTTFNGIMPRYPLTPSDMAILVRYLELLSAHDSPGASPTLIKFATILTDDVSAADREAMLVQLRRFVASQNHQLDMYRDFLKFGYKPTGDMKYSFRKTSLALWELKGPPETWAKQLAAYYNADPVFAVLGGISNQSWQPIHDFCEAQRLPCLFPITMLPVVDSDSWYTLYLNKGYFQEGEAAARFLQPLLLKKPQGRILQLVQNSDAGRALAKGFSSVNQSAAKATVERIEVTAELLQDKTRLSRLIANIKPQFLFIWADAKILPHLQDIAAQAAADASIFVSSSIMGAQLTTIPDSLRPQVYITFPYRLKPYFGDEEGLGKLAPNPINTTYKNFADKRVATRTAVMLAQSVTQGLRLLYDNLNRDYLIDVLSMQMDKIVFDYERLSFGSGQRYASKGCYILQIGPGPEPALIPRSPWVIR